MSYYLLEERIRPCNAEDLHDNMDSKYVAVLTTPEWKEARDSFDMGIELEPDAGNIHNTKAEVNYDSLTGTFLIPDRHDLKEKDSRFAFALDEKGIVFIDDSGKAEEMINVIRRTKRWREGREQAARRERIHEWYVPWKYGPRRVRRKAPMRSTMPSRRHAIRVPRNYPHRQ